MIHINFVTDNAIMQLLQDIGKAYAALASFDCKKAVALFETLPPHQLNTCWVLQQIGTAYFEMTDYHRVCFLIFHFLHLRGRLVLIKSTYRCIFRSGSGFS